MKILRDKFPKMPPSQFSTGRSPIKKKHPGSGPSSAVDSSVLETELEDVEAAPLDPNNDVKGDIYPLHIPCCISKETFLKI